jgi:hypothetical protein
MAFFFQTPKLYHTAMVGVAGAVLTAIVGAIKNKTA